ARLTLATHGYAFNDVIKPHATAECHNHRNRVRVPIAQHLAVDHDIAVSDSELRPSRHHVRFAFTTAIVDDADFTVPSEHDVELSAAADGAQRGQPNGTTTLALQIALFEHLRRATTDVERTHRQLRSGFTDTLGSDDADCHPFFDQCPGGHVHPVAA